MSQLIPIIFVAIRDKVQNHLGFSLTLILILCSKAVRWVIIEYMQPIWIIQGENLLFL